VDAVFATAAIPRVKLGGCGAGGDWCLRMPFFASCRRPSHRAGLAARTGCFEAGAVARERLAHRGVLKGSRRELPTEKAESEETTEAREPERDRVVNQHPYRRPAKGAP
jgi:hypothetical protein